MPRKPNPPTPDTRQDHQADPLPPPTPDTPAFRALLEGAQAPTATAPATAQPVPDPPQPFTPSDPAFRYTSPAVQHRARRAANSLAARYELEAAVEDATLQLAAALRGDRTRANPSSLLAAAAEFQRARRKVWEEHENTLVRHLANVVALGKPIQRQVGITPPPLLTAPQVEDLVSWVLDPLPMDAWQDFLDKAHDRVARGQAVLAV